MKKIIVGSVLLLLAMSICVPSVFAKGEGNTFQAIWNAITGLQNQVDNIQLIPGPQGEPGESNWDESRVAQLEEMVDYLEAIVVTIQEPKPLYFLEYASFDKSLGQYLSISDVDQVGLDITGDMTIETWFQLGSALSGNDRVIVSKYSPDANLSFDCAIDGFGNLKFVNSSDGSSIGVATISMGTLNTSTWYYLAVTYNSSAGQIEVFIDGVSKGTATGTLTTSIYNGTASFMIGNFDGGSDYFDGNLDEVRVWNDIRTLDEILIHSHIELVGNEPNLIGYWKFNNNTLDSSLNGHHLINNNGVTFVADEL